MVRAEQGTILFDQFQDGRFLGGTVSLEGTIRERVSTAMNVRGGRRSQDYITVDRAENKAFSRLTRTVRQAWLKLTTHRAFVTITGSLETEFPG